MLPWQPRIFNEYFYSIFFSGIKVNTFTSNSLQFINRQMFKTQYYKNHLFLAFSRQNAPLPWQQTKIASWSSSYFDEYLKGYLCAKFGTFAKKLTIFSQIRWTIIGAQQIQMVYKLLFFCYLKSLP